MKSSGKKVRRLHSQKSSHYPSIPSDADPVLNEEEQLLLLDAAPNANRYRKNEAPEKVLGAVYTPPRVAAALTRWAVRSSSDIVLDPSCGEGVFLSAARTRLADLGARRPQCIGVDIDEATARQSGAICSDFFSWVKTASPVDVILGNPPFIRSHLFQETSRSLAFAGLSKLGLRPSRLMSTWAPFLALSCGLLKPSGRLAMVIPEELLAVGYAQELRVFLLRHFQRVIVCFPSTNIFTEVQQAVVLLMCDNDSNGHQGLLTLDYTDLEEGNFSATQLAPVWDWNSKWTHLFLSTKERRSVNEWWSEFGWMPFSEYGRVEVGIVTGDNGYFVLRKEQAEKFNARHIIPIVTSARDLQGIWFGSDDFKRVVAQDRPAYLLNISEPKPRLSASENEYIKLGEKNQVSDRYKCRIRDPWYAVPSIWEPDAVLLRQAGDMPRLIHLAKKCAATDTIHRVSWHQSSQGRRHAVSFMNTWTLLASELTGRSYGGGVLELMPGEANKLPMPNAVDALDKIFDQVDERVRMRDPWAGVELVNDVVLPSWMKTNDRDLLSSILKKLIQRRKTRAN